MGSTLYSSCIFKLRFVRPWTWSYTVPSALALPMLRSFHPLTPFDPRPISDTIVLCIVVMDIPPQYGPGYDGGFDDMREKFAKSITGRDGKSWNLPLPFDDELQPLYTGPPLPLSVLQAAGIKGDNGKKEDSYQSADPDMMAKACRDMAGWKLASNGEAVARFAARGGPKGGTNPRKTFGAQLADPYAEADKEAQPYADAALRAVCKSLLADDNDAALHAMKSDLQDAVPSDQAGAVAASLAYLRDRVGVPRDLPLASARHLRAHINYAIQSIV